MDVLTIIVVCVVLPLAGAVVVLAHQRDSAHADAMAWKRRYYEARKEASNE